VKYLLNNLFPEHVVQSFVAANIHLVKDKSLILPQMGDLLR
jgi:hypothetical protein